MNTFSTVGSVRRSNGRTALGAALLVLAASVTFVDASVIGQGLRWGGNPLVPTGEATIIKICWVDGSSSSEDSFSGSFHSTPSLNDVLSRVRNAVNDSWAIPSSVSFQGWGPCSEIAFVDRPQYVGLYIHSEVQAQIAGFGPNNLLGTTSVSCSGKDDVAAQFFDCDRNETECTDAVPFGCGGTWNPAGINLQPWGTLRTDPSHCVELFDGYSFDCVEQYAIHEFGHALGLLHEMTHPNRTTLAPSCGSSEFVVERWVDYYDPLEADSIECDGIGGVCQTDADCAEGFINCLDKHVVVSPDVYDFDSVMAYGPGCANTTGVRFGSPRADALDIQGVVEVYGPPTSPNFYSDITAWRSLLVNAGFAYRGFLTTATNVALANEVAAPPTANLSVGSPLTFLATTAGLPFSFTLDALQPGGWMVYWDQSLPGWDGTLSIGDVNPSGCDDCYADDDFELSFDPTSNIYGVGFYLVDNNFESGEKIYVYGASGLLAECGGGPDPCVILPADSGAAGSFIGVIADEPITSIRFDENAGGDDIAIRDLSFAYGPQTGIAYPDLPVTPLAINASTTCSGAGDNPLQRTIHVPDDFVIGDVNLAFNATHTYREDVRVILRSPSGTEVNVIGQGEMATGYDVLLDDSALGPLSNGLDDDTAAPYFAREATPTSPLSTFVGERAGGDWIVEICDNFGSDGNGEYNRSQLILQPKQPTATEPVVTSALDTVDPTDGVTTLREAMAVANATNGTITFDPSLAGQEIPISTAALDVSGAPLESAFLVDSAVLIDGADAPGLIIVISGSSPLRHFGVNASGHLTLRNLTLSGGTGSSGGAIEVRGDAAGATARAVRGYLSVENSTFELNSATSVGGAIRVVTGTAVLTNTTVFQNSAGVGGGGALYCGAESDCRVLSSTFASNSGGGIYNFNSQLLLENSFVANNNGADLTGNPVSAASHHNLVGDPASAGGLIEGANNNLVGDGNGGLLPGFFYYGDNGGPTWTVLPSARGIDAGQTFLPFDQRGAPRKAPADIGAVEIPRYEVSTTVDDGAGSLREAVASVLAFHGGTIDILTSGPIVLTTPSAGESAFVIDAALTIEGNGATILRDPSAPNFRLFDVVSGSLTLRDLTLMGGVASVGGVIRASGGFLTVERSTIADGSANSGGGGGISAGSFFLVDSTVRGNFAAGNGGGIDHRGGTSHVTNSTIVDNFGGSGGGIAYYATSSQFTQFLDNSTLSGNQSVNGGALFSDAATVTIDSSSIVGNTASSLGGGILKINNGTMLLRNTVVAGNTRSGFDQDIEYVLGSGVSAASHHNLISTPASAGGLIHGVNFNILGDGAGGVLPLATILNPSLVYNGGSTWTHDLVPTSPAIDAGLTVLSTDQRGVSRPQGSTYDIGAVEYLLIPTQIIVAVQTLPGGDPTLFSFAGDASGTIADGQSIFATVTPGTYGVSEESGAIVDKIAFVTSGGYSGDLVTEANGLGLGPFNPSLPGEGLQLPRTERGDAAFRQLHGVAQRQLDRRAGSPRPGRSVGAHRRRARGRGRDRSDHLQPGLPGQSDRQGREWATPTSALRRGHRGPDHDRHTG
jgi:subtilisin-like proprotein convertase family protein